MVVSILVRTGQNMMLPAGLRAWPLSHSAGLLVLYLLQVACAEGTLYTLTVPQLQVVSKVTLFPSPFVCLLCSPDRQWLFASAHNSDLGPKVSA